MYPVGQHFLNNLNSLLVLGDVEYPPNKTKSFLKPFF